MKDAQKPDHVSLGSIIGRMREGRFVIPDFQREFEWSASDIQDLMRSIFSDYYIGSLLLWKSKEQNIKLLSSEGLYGFSGKASPEYIVLDGQQRLTAMYYAFMAPDRPLPRRVNRAIYYVSIDKFMAGETDSAFGYEWLTKKTKALIDTPALQFEKHFFPLSIIGKEDYFAIPNWVQGYHNFWVARAAAEKTSEGRLIADANAKNALAFGQELQDIITKYQISYIELDKEIGVEKVCDIFTQINSKGIKLDVFDLLNALMKPQGIQLKQLYRTSQKRLAFADTPKMNVYILQVMSILRQNYCSPKYLYFLQPGVEKPLRSVDGARGAEVLIKDSNEFFDYWEKATSALERVIALLQHPQEYGATSSRYIPYVSILPAFAAIHSRLTALPANQQLSGRKKLRHWYWASVFLSRYSSSVESTAARDFVDMGSWLTNDDAKPSMIEEFAERYRSIDLHIEVKRGSSVYNAIFNLFVLAGARDWMTGDVPRYGDLDDHHIVPAWWGRDNQIEEVNSILNRSPLTSDTNRNVIREQLPNEYLPELIVQNGEAAVLGILESHFISKIALSILLRNPFTPKDFEEFLSERRRTLLDGIDTLLIKERLDLPVNLRTLDAAIEQVELTLRDIIVKAIDNQRQQLPAHLLEGADERIQRALRKNAVMSPARFQLAEGVLEYFDLRALQDTIMSKVLWEKFADRFKNKETLSGKFSQLAELRNSIRHSRAVDAITLKEGEAAVLWFEQVLSS